MASKVVPTSKIQSKVGILMGEEDSVSESEGYGQEEESKSPFKMPNSRIPAYDTFKIKACVLRAK